MVYDKKHKNPAQKIILVVIILAVLSVIVSTFYAFTVDNEQITKNKISDLASEYYEHYFYPSMSIDEDRLDEVMSRYTEIGINSTSLRQIILSTNNNRSATADFIRKYCDENSTIVKFFPEPPYTNTSYHTEYSYSCSF